MKIRLIMAINIIATKNKRKYKCAVVNYSNYFVIRVDTRANTANAITMTIAYR